MKMLQKFKSMTTYNKFYYILFGLFILMSLSFSVYAIAENDLFFIIPTGKYIINTGKVPIFNEWLANKEQYPFVVHQWLYAVIVGGIQMLDGDKAIGIFYLTIIQVLIFYTFVYKYFRAHTKPMLLEFVVFVTLMFNTYLRSPRPELVTIFAVIIEIVGLEKYRTTNRKRWLWCLPLSTIWMVNFHSIMWPILYAILIAYIVPSIWKKAYKSTNIKLNLPVLGSIIASIGGLFCSPYGYKNVILPFISLQIANVYKNNVTELNDLFTAWDRLHVITGSDINTSFLFIKLSMILPLFIGLFVAGKLLSKGYYNGRIYLTSSHLYLYLGFALMSVMSMRNMMFSAVGLIFIFCDYLVCVECENERFKVNDINNDGAAIVEIDDGCNVSKHNKFVDKINSSTFLNDKLVRIALAGLYIIFTLLFGILTYEAAYTNYIDLHFLYYEDLADVIRNDPDYTEDSVTFSSFNETSGLVYNGLTNLYMDVRMEYITLDFTEIGVNFCNIMDSKGLTMPKSEYFALCDEFFATHRIDYIVCNDFSETPFSTYMEEHPADYELIETRSYSKFEGTLPQKELYVYKTIKK